MDVRRSSSASTFLDETTAYRSAEPLRTNVLGSVALSAGAGILPADDAFWWTVVDGGDVVGAAMRTPPFGLALGPMPDDAARVLAVAVAEHDDAFPAIGGPAGSVRSFLDAYAGTGSKGAGRAVVAERRDVLRHLGTLQSPAPTGVLELATVADVDEAQVWMTAFSVEIDGPSHRESEEDRRALLDTIRAGRLRWLRSGKARVSMAGHAPPVEAPSGVVTRVGPVYTPPEERRRGFAASVTAGVAQVLVSRGDRVMLFADAHNATSNGVYQSIGFDVVDEFLRYTMSSST